MRLGEAAPVFRVGDEAVGRALELDRAELRVTLRIDDLLDARVAENIADVDRRLVPDAEVVRAVAGEPRRAAAAGRQVGQAVAERVDDDVHVAGAFQRVVVHARPVDAVRGGGDAVEVVVAELAPRHVHLAVLAPDRGVADVVAEHRLLVPLPFVLPVVERGIELHLVEAGIAAGTDEQGTPRGGQIDHAAEVGDDRSLVVVEENDDAVRVGRPVHLQAVLHAGLQAQRHVGLARRVGDPLGEVLDELRDDRG